MFKALKKTKHIFYKEPSYSFLKKLIHSFINAHSFHDIIYHNI